MTDLDPIRRTFTVPASPDVAFEVFTVGMGSWWDPAYTPDAASFDGIEVGPEVGDPVTMVHGDSAYTFGNVTVWEPGQRFGQTFWLAMDPAHPSTVEARFGAEGGGTRVDFEHGGWTPDNVGVRAKYGDWNHILGLYEAAVSG